MHSVGELPEENRPKCRRASVETVEITEFCLEFRISREPTTTAHASLQPAILRETMADFWQHDDEVYLGTCKQT